MKKILSLVVALVMVMTVVSALAAGSKGSDDIPTVKTSDAAVSIEILPDGTEESNALILKAHFPEAPISVDASCCAGVTPALHEAALTTMKSCQIDVH